MRSPILPPPGKPKLKRKRPRSMLLGLLGFGFAAGVALLFVGAAAAGYLLWEASKDLPSYERLAEYEPPVMTRIHAHDGSMIKEYYRERRIFVPINTVPARVVQAFISAEDKRFYEHGGLDFIGIARASFKYAERLITGRGAIQGASTITQQVAKNMLLTNDRTFDRKIREAILATRIERAFPKDKILELYLNEIFLGTGAYGIAAAGLTYFNKELKDLTIEEAAYLAVLPKAPSYYHPYRRNKEATARRNWIIDEMAGNGFITRPEADAAKAKPLAPSMRSFGVHVYASEFFAEDVRRTLLSQYGEEKLNGGGLSVRTTLDPKLQEYAYRALQQGLVEFDRVRGWRGALQKIDVSGDWGVRLAQIDVATDIAPWRIGVVLEVTKANVLVGLRPAAAMGQQIGKEREAVRVAFEEMRWAGRFTATDQGKGRAPGQPGDVVNVGDVIWVAPKEADKPDGQWSLMQVPEVGGGLLAMDPHTGRILAVAGGFSFEISQFDRALQAKRQPGSSYKPLVYATALDNGYKPTSIVLDEPVDIEQKPGVKWDPSNYGGGQGAGPSTLRTGIEKSRNLMTARLGQDLGMPVIVEYSKRFGAYEDLAPLPAMVLGAGETTVVRMVTAYAAFANGGKQVRATLVDRIQDRWGKTVWRHDQRICESCKSESWQNQAEPEIPDDRKQIIDPHTAFQMTSMLEGVVNRGTGTIIRKYLPSTPVAGKTGTTNDSKDTWFVGYSPDLVVGVYVGYDNPKPMGKSATGGAVAAPIFGNFMKLALADKKAVPFRQPPGIKQVWVNKTTGLRAARGEGDAITEYFKPGEEPDDGSSFLGFEQAAGDAAAGGAPRGGGVPVRDPYAVGPRPARAPQGPFGLY
jgi:penicillin-binding protein 1A